MKDINVTERFNGGNKKRYTHKNFDHWQLMDKIELYERQTKIKEDRDKLLEIKDQYIKKEQKKPMNRAIRNSFFKDGLIKGLHQDKDYSALIEQDKVNDQKDRDQTHNEVKNLYHKNFSLIKRFEKTQDKMKDKEYDKNK